MTARAFRRVLSYPPRHDYVDRLVPEAAELVHRDEPWPLLRRYYDPSWAADHAADWDVAHLHFTWEQHPADRVADVLDAHRRAGVPIVWTAHDLRNPHTMSGCADDVYLDLLAAHADHVLTLTPGAAAEIGRRFGRSARVVPHGPILDPSAAARWRRRRPHPGPVRRLLLHAKSLRANLAWQDAIDAVAALRDEGAPIVLDLGVHPGAAHLVSGTSDGVDVRVHGPLDPDELCARIAAADALLLPYRWGTHSGLLELAVDLGVPVIAANVGHLRDQSPAVLADASGPSLVPGLVAALRRWLGGEVPQPMPLAQRRAQLDALVASHREIYDAAVRSAG